MPIASIGALQNAQGQAEEQVGNVAQIIYGFHQLNKSKKDLAALGANLPTRTTDPLYLYNQKLAQQNAGQGFSGAENNLYANIQGQNTAQGINAIEKTGQGQNLISQLLGQNNNDYLKYLAMDAVQHRENLKQLYTANTDLANQNNINWDVNTYVPWQQKFAAANQMSNAGIQNAIGGIKNQGAANVAGSTTDYGNLMNSIGSGYGQQPSFSNSQAQIAGGAEGEAHNLAGF